MRKLPGGPALGLILAKGCSSRSARKTSDISATSAPGVGGRGGRESGVIDHLILSTEDSEVAESGLDGTVDLVLGAGAPHLGRLQHEIVRAADGGPPAR